MRGDAISRERGLNKNWNARPPKLLWKRDVGDKGFAGPSVAHGKVFFVDHDGGEDVVRALDAVTGKEIWSYRYADSDSAKYGFARATPTVSGGKVYTFSRLAKLNCLDERTGKPVWSVDTLKDMGGVLPYQWDASASPVVDGKKLYVVTGVSGKPVAAFDKDTGKVLWQGGAKDYASHSSPVIARIDGRKQCLAFLGTSLQGIDPDTGAVIWSFPWPSGNIGQPIAVGPNSVYVSTQYNIGSVLVDVHGNQATPRWKSKEIQAHFNTPVLVDGYLYGTSDPGFLMCVEAATGKVVWKQPGFEKGGVLAVDATILAVNGANGDVTMAELTPKGYRELGKFQGLGGQSWSPPVFSGGKLIVRNEKSMACWDLR
jgi:outer membrane protein assembly factor BamB